MHFKNGRYRYLSTPFVYSRHVFQIISSYIRFVFQETKLFLINLRKNSNIYIKLRFKFRKKNKIKYYNIPYPNIRWYFETSMNFIIRSWNSKRVDPFYLFQSVISYRFSFLKSRYRGERVRISGKWLIERSFRGSTARNNETRFPPVPLWLRESAKPWNE